MSSSDPEGRESAGASQLAGPMALDALLFDIDGTLLRLERPEPAAGATAPAGRGSGYGDRMRRFWIQTETPLNYGMMLAERAGLSRSLAPAVRWARRAKGIAPEDRSHLVEGCRETLVALSERVPLGVVTNRNADAARALLMSHGLETLVSVIVSRSDVWRLKPHPAPVLLAAAQLGVRCDRTAMIGDMPVDMRAAKRAGARAIGVLTGLGSESELAKAGADLVLPSVRDLGAWLTEGSPCMKSSRSLEARR